MNQRITRRTMIAGLGGLGLGFGLTDHCFGQEPLPAPADEAFAQLRAGNGHFAEPTRGAPTKARTGASTWWESRSHIRYDTGM
jgi:hypothetical protein